MNTSAKNALAPDLGIRSWDDIDREQKEIIWKHFINKGWFAANEFTYRATSRFAEDYKARALCENLLQHAGPHYKNDMRGYSKDLQDCCLKAANSDFENIFLDESQDVAYELISYFVPTLGNDYLDKEKTQRFINLFNDISNQFGMNVLLNENGFTLRQDEKIIEEVYKPVLNFLSDEKWAPVNRDLADANMAYLRNTNESYSTAITLTISALQGFLQIIVNGKTGKGDLGQLITEAQNKSLIPNDAFTKKIFKDIESVLMTERQEKGHPHPKKEYANEKTTKLILNLTMVFMQHCLQI